MSSISKQAGTHMTNDEARQTRRDRNQESNRDRDSYRNRDRDRDRGRDRKKAKPGNATEKLHVIIHHAQECVLDVVAKVAPSFLSQQVEVESK